jgi:hypothetical protein
VEAEAITAGDIVPVYIGASGDEYDSADHWVEQEVDNLKQDLEEAEVLRVRAEMQCVTAQREVEKWSAKFHDIKQNIDNRVDEMNGKVRQKAMIYLDLIAEYETVLAVYEGHSQVRLITSKIHNLRKRGGLQV